MTTLTRLRDAQSHHNRRQSMDLNATIAAAIAAHKAGNLPLATIGYMKILRARPNHPDALHFLGMLRFQQGDHAAGIALVERSVKADAENPHAWNNLGNMRMAKDDAGGAREAYERATSLADGLPEAWYNLGLISRRQRDFEAAVVNFEKAIRAGPSFS